MNGQKGYDHKCDTRFREHDKSISSQIKSSRLGEMNCALFYPPLSALVDFWLQYTNIFVINKPNLKMYETEDIVTDWVMFLAAFVSRNL